MIKNISIKDFDSFQLFQILKYLSTLTISILLAKSQLSLHDLGQFESFVFLSSTVSFFWINGSTQNLLVLQPRFNKGSQSINSLYVSCAILMFSFSAISGIIIFIALFNNLIEGLFSLSNKYIILFLIYCLINPITHLSEFILLLERKNNTLIKFGFFTLIISVCLTSFPAIAGLSLDWCLTGFAIWSCIKYIYLIILLKKYSVFKINFPEIKQFLVYSFPLILISLISGFAPYADSLIINLGFSSEQFAVFRYGSREFPYFMIIASSFAASMLPKLSGAFDFHSTVNEMKIKSRKIIYYCFPIAIILLLSSKYLYLALFNQNLAESYRIFDIYLLLIISRFVFPQTILASMMKNRILLGVSAIELALNISVSLILLNYIGLIGVAWGTVIAFIFEKIVLAFMVWIKTGIKPIQYIPIKELSAFSILILTVYVIKYIAC
ncbi:MAG: hypothetical protein U0W24_26280 [Bacteroidales bacterium]